MALSKFEDNGVTYFQLYIRCPVCIGQGKTDLPLVFWTHTDDNCGGNLYIGDNAFFKCRKCGFSDHVIKLKWKYGGFACHHSDEECLRLQDAIGLVGQIVTETGNEWLRRFLENMGNF